MQTVAEFLVSCAIVFIVGHGLVKGWLDFKKDQYQQRTGQNVGQVGGQSGDDGFYWFFLGDMFGRSQSNDTPNIPVDNYYDGEYYNGEHYSEYGHEQGSEEIDF